MRDDCRYLNNAIKKHGWENFTVEVLGKTSYIEKLDDYERKFIRLYQTYEKGYNLTIGGKGVRGYKWTDAQRKKFLETFKRKRKNGEWPMLRNGGHNKGKPISEEQKEKLRSHWTPEKRKAQSDKMKEMHASGKFLNNRKKRKVCTRGGRKIIATKDNITTIFSSIAEASRSLSIGRSSISKCCRKLQNQSNGYHFNYM